MLKNVFKALSHKKALKMQIPVNLTKSLPSLKKMFHCKTVLWEVTQYPRYSQKTQRKKKSFVKVKLPHLFKI